MTDEQAQVIIRQRDAALAEVERLRERERKVVETALRMATIWKIEREHHFTYEDVLRAADNKP